MSERALAIMRSLEKTVTTQSATITWPISQFYSHLGFPVRLCLVTETL